MKLGRIVIVAGTAVAAALVALAAVRMLRPRPADTRATVRRLWAQRNVEKPNVLLITLDTTRADHLGAYGYPLVETPNLDALARGGVLFGQAMSPSPLTLPAHSSIMTGTYPTYHGVRVNGNAALSSSQTTLAEALSARGYATGAFVAAFVLDRRWGLDQGFDAYDDRFDLSKYKHVDLGGVQRPANEVMDSALEWLNGHQKGPFFAWIHLYDPHTPYDPPEPFRSRYQSRGLPGLYDGEIAFVDQQIGRCLSWLRTTGIEDRTVVVVMADHGEALGSHDEATHGFFVYDYALRIPLLIRPPFDELRGVKVESQVSAVDVFPTVLELVGAEARGEVHGRSLLPVMLDPRQERAGQAYGESMAPNLHYGWSSLHTLRTERFKLIKAPRPELYDVSADPGETSNVYASHGKVAGEMMRKLERLMVDTSRGVPKPEAADLDSETRERLAALGYMGGPVEPPASGASSVLADPKDKLRVFAAVQQAGDLIVESRYAEAAAALESALRDEPRMPQALLILGGAYLELGKVEDAKAQFDTLLKDDPRNVQALVGLANLLMRQGRTSEVVTLCKRTLSLDEKNNQAHALLGEAYAGDGRPQEALTHFEKAVEIQPKLTQNKLNLAGAQIEVGQIERAEALLEQILEQYPRFPLARFNLGLLHEKQGRRAEARAAYEAEIAAYPRQFKARFNLGKILYALDDRPGAIAQMREVIRIAPKRPEGYLFLARGLLQEPGALDESQAVAEKGLGLATTPDLKALGYFLLADVFNRRRQPEKMNEALKSARDYASAIRSEAGRASAIH